MFYLSSPQCDENVCLQRKNKLCYVSTHSFLGLGLLCRHQFNYSLEEENKQPRYFLLCLNINDRSKTSSVNLKEPIQNFQKVRSQNAPLLQIPQRSQVLESDKTLIFVFKSTNFQSYLLHIITTPHAHEHASVKTHAGPNTRAQERRTNVHARPTKRAPASTNAEF